MNVLLVGGGGREHALAWKISQSPELTRLVAAPGNPGINGLAELRPVAATDVEGLAELAREIRADLVVVGPEAALEAGLADRLAQMAVPCFGPTAAAARIETSKAYAKDFAARHGLPTARFEVCSDLEAARRALDGFSPPYVVKADGLAAGKGVTIAETRADAEMSIEYMLGGRLGEAGARVVIEEFLSGEEASFFALCDGESTVPFGGAQDHKRAFDGDAGPNTGGMGAYSPAPVLSPEMSERVQLELIHPAVRGLKADGAPYRGVLYAGLVITDDGPKLVEFNARFGDPECQVLMLRLKSDLMPYLHAAATGRLGAMPEPRWSQDAAICVVMAARGYPESPLQGSVIYGAEGEFGPDVVVFNAGAARREDGALVAAGGRVLNVCARGASLDEARQRAYAAVSRINWPGGFYRTDIGWRALGRR